MIAWWWLILAFFAGGMLGMLAMALCAIARD